MAELLQDKDRIFQNLYGLHDHGLEGAKKRGAWVGTSAMLEQGSGWIIDQVKASGLRGWRCGFPDGPKMVLHAKRRRESSALSCRERG